MKLKKIGLTVLFIVIALFVVIMILPDDEDEYDSGSTVSLTDDDSDDGDDYAEDGGYDEDGDYEADDDDDDDLHIAEEVVVEDSKNPPVELNAEVYKVFLLTNKFRTGKEAFYLNKDNSTKTKLVGKLAELRLDKDLCKVANLRAKELVKKFSHTRPNGKDCFSALDQLSVSYAAAGENIACGVSTGEGTFEQWKEDDEDYAGQGHRRNMLGKDFTRIGIACVKSEKGEYKYYWCMVLAR